MPVVNPLARELVFKIVYYGPGLGGKTTTLHHIHTATAAEHRGKMVSLATPVDRTLYFDFLPIRVPNVRGLGVRLQLFTVPGQVYYNATRKLVLTGADAVVFVADSQRARLDANLESLENLQDNLREHGRSLTELPFALAYNKRDLDDLLEIGELERRLNRHGAPHFSTCATSGKGVFETLDAVARMVLDDFEQRMPDSKEGPFVGFGLAEGGLVDALRAADAAGGEARVVRPSVSEDDDPVAGESAARMVAGEEAKRSRRPPAIDSSAPLVLSDVATLPPAAPSLSFLPLWADEDRTLAREVEANLQREQHAAAALGCSTLVRRCLDRHAGEGEAALAVSLLALGVDAARHVWLGKLTEAVRGGAQPSRGDALLAYLFAVDVAVRVRAQVERFERAPSSAD